MDEATGRPAFTSLATIVVLMAYFSFFSKSVGLVFLGQQEGRHRAVRFCDNPQLVACVCSIAAQEPEPVLEAVVVFLSVLVGQIAPLAANVEREELARLLFRFPKRGQSARCCDDLAEFESRLFAELLH